MELTTSQALDVAADIVEVRGWSRGGGWYPDPDSLTPVCVEGAIRLAVGAGRKTVVTKTLCDYLTSRFPECINTTAGYVIGFSWNDTPGRTAAEVIEVLRACALIESAREEQDAVWQSYATNVAQATA